MRSFKPMPSSRWGIGRFIICRRVSARFQNVQKVLFAAKSDKGCRNCRVKNHVALIKNNDDSKLPEIETNRRSALLISGPRVRVPGGAPDIERQIVRFGVFLLCNPEKSGSARSMHGFCTVGVFVGILCMGWNCFEMRGKFCIRPAEPDGAAPLLRGLRPSEVPAERSWRWSVRLRRVQPAGWGFPV